MSQPMFSTPRLIALDGLRAISILLVASSHVLGIVGAQWIPGGLGVTIFFFISGFIITRLLLNEEVNTGQIQWSAFYQRRLWRLAPALLVYVVVCCCCFALIGGRMRISDIVAVIFYYANYHSIYSGYSISGFFGLPVQPLAITWSLSVEEHFYFVFPLALIWLRRKPGKLAAGLIAFILATLIWRMTLVFGVGLDQLPPDRIYMASDTRLDSIAFGCLLSVIFHLATKHPKGSASLMLDRLSSPWALVTSILVLIWTLTVRSEDFRQSIRYSIQGLMMMPLFCCLFWRGTVPLTVRAILENRIMVFIGGLSYSLYLYHFLGLALAYALLAGKPMLEIGFTIVFGVMGALCSYYIVEKPVRRFGTRNLWTPGPSRPAV